MIKPGEQGKTTDHTDRKKGACFLTAVTNNGLSFRPPYGANTVCAYPPSRIPACAPSGQLRFSGANKGFDNIRYSNT
jgi:hypothetical protein